MAKKRLTTEQIIGVLKQLDGGRTAAEVAREAGVSQHTVYAWKAKYGGLEVNEAEELRSLRDENNRLKRLVADLSLDKDMLKSVIQKNGYSSRV
jgi:putative transposase